MAGRFITLEGGEGVGKSTQTRALAAALRATGRDVVETREPGGPIRALLVEGEADRWSAVAEALLFAAARADHVERLIAPALAAGRWVICDRYLDSTIAYQGGAGGVAAADLRTLHRIGSGGLMPDRTLLLRIAEDESAARLRIRDAGRADRFGDRDGAYHARVAAAFAAIAAAEPERVRVVDGSGAPEAVTARLLAALDGL